MSSQSAVPPSLHSPSTGRKANWAFVFSHPAHWLGLGLGSGLAPVAPGTAGTLMGWAIFVALERLLVAPALGVLIAAGVLVGWWACTVSARNLGVPDPGCIVWDEMVAFWLVLWLLLPAVPLLADWTYRAWQLAAFVLFRYFDAAKPGPVRWADQVFKGTGWRGGWGIMFDDLVAAFCTLLVLAVARHVCGFF